MGEPSKEALKAAREHFNLLGIKDYAESAAWGLAHHFDRFTEQRVAAAVQEERERCFAWALGRVPRSRTCQAIRDGEDPHTGYLPKDPSLCWRCGETLHPGHDCSTLGA